MSARVLSINISEKKGVVKKPVATCRLIADFGLENDAHAEPGIRQVSLLANESVDKMRAKGVEGLGYGVFAENLTTEGLELHTLPIGTRFQIGDALLEVSKIGKECHHGCAIKQQVGSCIMPTEGIFAKVITGGEIHSGDAIVLL